MPQDAFNLIVQLVLRGVQERSHRLLPQPALGGFAVAAGALALAVGRGGLFLAPLLAGAVAGALGGQKRVRALRGGGFAFDQVSWGWAPLLSRGGGSVQVWQWHDQRAARHVCFARVGNQ